MLFFGNKQPKRIYLDFASTTPVDPEVVKEMTPYFSEKFFNAASLYKEGVESRKVVDDARKRISKHIGCQVDDVVFTSGGTEANNLAILGVVRHAKNILGIAKPHVITTVIEHPAVLEVCRAIEKEGAEVTYIPVNEEGLIDLEEFKKALRPETVLITIIYVNNEIGVIQPIKEMGRIVKLWKRDNKREVTAFPYFHIDASQAPNYLSIDRNPLGVDMMTLDGSKIYGPKGIGVLFRKSYISLYPLMFGGGQENGLRPGTENVPLIVGFAKALDLVTERKETEVQKIKALQDYFIDQLAIHIPSATLNGSRTERIPNNVNICIKGMNAEFTVLQLDNKGICCTFMTSCKNLNEESSSYVVEALHSSACDRSSLRFTLGTTSTKGDIDTAISELKKAIPLSHL